MAVLSERSRRALWIDVARGGAIVAMVLYHFSFDLAFFGFVDWRVGSDPLWRTFAASIASTFLFIVGVSLVYAHGTRIRWRGFLKRLAVIAGCAALVTIGTAFAMPVPIYFGILHAIAVFSVLALPFLRAPPWLTLIAAGLVLTAPLYLTADVFNAPWFYPLGLATIRPFAFDYEPVFPWFAVTLLGVAAGRLIPRPDPAQSGYRHEGRALALVAAAGRNSLAIYLIHQPVLFGLMMLLVMAMNWVLGNAATQ